jgi:hypothetical protein
MGQSIFINSRCRAIDDLRTRKFSPFVAGDSLVLDLFLTGTTGLLNIQDYSTVRVGIGNLNARPESGTYLVGGFTLDYNHSGAELEATIESVTGNGCSVVELSPFVFKVSFDAVGAQTIPAIDSADLTPRSTVDRQTLQAGDATTKEIWLWRLYANPIAFTDVFTNIAGNGVQGTIALSTAGIYDLLGDNASVKTFFEVELTDSVGDIITVMQTSIDLTGEVIGEGFSGYIPSPSSGYPAQLSETASDFLYSFANSDLANDSLPEIDARFTITNSNSLGYALRLPDRSSDGYILRSDAGGNVTWSKPAPSFPYTTSIKNGVATTEDLSSTTGASGFSGDLLLTSIYAGSNLTDLGANTFSGSSNLTQAIITAPQNLSDNLFLNCSSLAKLELPYGVEFTGNSTFKNCTSLASFDFPDSMYLTGTDSFRGCTSLVNIGSAFPSLMNTIGNYSFADCTSLETAIFDVADFYQVQTGAFRGCTSLQRFRCNYIDAIGGFAFEGCTSLTILEFGNYDEGLEELGESCFRNCTLLTIIDIPSNSIGVTQTFQAAVFRDCTSLVTINLYALTPPTLVGSNHFLNVATTEIHVRAGATGYGTTFGGLTVVYDLPEPT